MMKEAEGMNTWWNYITGLASIIGLVFGFYQFWKSKKVSEVASSFFDAISAESHSVLDELDRIKKAENLDINAIKAKIETTYYFMASVNNTVAEFKKTLQQSKDRY
jgi:hypothetical protein